MRLLSFITAHFAVFSALSLVVIVLSSTIFLYGYLTAFDWQLIWIIEYPDILKFGLVALAVISSFIFIIQGIVANIVDAARRQGKAQWTALGVIIALIISLWVVSLAVEWRTEAVPRYAMYGSILVSVLWLISTSRLLTVLVVYRRTMKAERIIFIFVFVLFGVGVYGGTFGAYAKYSKGLTHDVFLKDRQMSNVRLVLFTSHHTVLYAGTDVVVLPTSEIMKIVAHPTDQQRWP